MKKTKKTVGAPVKAGGRFKVMAVSITQTEAKNLASDLDKINKKLDGEKLTKSQLMKFSIGKLSEFTKRGMSAEDIYQVFTSTETQGK